MNEQQITEETVLDCGHKPSPHCEHTTGYGKLNGKTYCWQCCADQDRAYMVEHGRISLYLSDNGVTNWPGTLVFKVGYSKRGRHNISGSRTDVWFTGPDGKNWRGTQYGEWTQICHCRRVRS